MSRWIGSRAVSRLSTEVNSSVGRRRGFTLLEILVALVILGLSLGIYLQIFSAGIGSTRAAQSLSTAVMLAESKLAALGAEEPLAAGESQGRFDDRFRWRAIVAPFSAEGDPQRDAGRRVELYAVQVIVSWQGLLGERSYALSSLKLSQLENR